MSKIEWKASKVNLSSAIVGAGVALVLGLLVGLNWKTFATYLGLEKLPIGQSTSSEDFSALNEVYDKIKSEYDGEVSDAELIEGAKAGLAEATGDKYTVYMTADEATEFNKTLHGEAGSGIGVVISLRDGYVRVTRTLPDNPARNAGVLAGDIIYKVDGEEVYSLSSDEIAQKLRGAAGTEVTLTVVRDGEEKEFKMTREKINNVSAEVSYDGDTAIIMVTRFDTDTGTIIQNYAKDFANKGIKKVILDLRDNGGGYVSAAKDLLSLWIDGDKILIQKSKGEVSETTYAARGGAILKDMKTTVLVNGSTASASEIVAGALKDYGKATIIGEKTYGKGVVQSLYSLSNDSLLKVTTAHWYTPNETSIDLVGIEPDVKVSRSYDDINSGKDPQMDEAKKR